ncbi:MAG: 2TM domain-containing protein [Betaproteobacteria bacterium]|nr:2TM domain-containing protein [Betaproteobacteria bacterium]
MYAVVIPALWIINLRAGGPIWAVWPTFGWGAGLVIHGLSVFAGRSFLAPSGRRRRSRKADGARENLKVVSREKQLVQAQMRLLQAQIEPHFLFNTLANIQSLIGRAPRQGQPDDGQFHHLPAREHAFRQPGAGRGRCGRSSRSAPLSRPIRIRMADRLSTRSAWPPDWKRRRWRRCCCSRWWKTRSNMGWKGRGRRGQR